MILLSILYKTGCVGKIINYVETDDSRYLITLLGIKKFTITKEIKHEKSFKIFEVKTYNYNFNYFNELEFNRDLLINKILLYFQQKNIKFKLEDLNSIENKQLINTLSMICPFEINEKQMLLESKNTSELSKKLLALLEFNNNKSNASKTIN